MTAGPGGGGGDVNEALAEIGRVHDTDGATAVLGKPDLEGQQPQQSKSPSRIALYVTPYGRGRDLWQTRTYSIARR